MLGIAHKIKLRDITKGHIDYLMLEYSWEEIRKELETKIKYSFLVMNQNMKIII